jgi:hypothetical protein
MVIIATRIEVQALCLLYRRIITTEKKYLALFQLATLLRPKALLRSGAAAAFLATSVARGKWFPWKFDLL